MMSLTRFGENLPAKNGRHGEAHYRVLQADRHRWPRDRSAGKLMPNSLFRYLPRKLKER